MRVGPDVDLVEDVISRESWSLPALGVARAGRTARAALATSAPTVATLAMTATTRMRWRLIASSFCSVLGAGGVVPDGWGCRATPG